MSKRSALFSILALSLWILSCDGSSRPSNADDGHGHGASYACGTVEAPVTFVLKDIAPAAGTTVANQNIVQQFTLVDPPFMLSNGLTFVFLATHTAGTPSPLPLQFTVATSGKDQVYSTTVTSWSTAPGHVEMGVPVQNILQAHNGCAFVFPSPLFSYDVTSP